MTDFTVLALVLSCFFLIGVFVGVLWERGEPNLPEIEPDSRYWRGPGE